MHPGSDLCACVPPIGNGTVRSKRRAYPGTRDVSEKGIGAAEGTRTPDPIITNDVLYRLSYSGSPRHGMAFAVTLLCR